MTPRLPKRYEMESCQLAAAPPPQLMLDAAPESVRTARAYAHEFVAYHLPGISGAYVDDLQLVVSELVTNAVRYGTEPGDSVLVLLAVTDTCVRIEVRDPVRRRPRFRAVSQERDRGRGLFIVEALAECWGVADRPLGKAVWAQVAR
ncbi:ATP-binding protein [Streptomyces sp. NPDC056987]|uniref:ATP-binding protein n=1 Tax=Streptomyces sp. NPDC056987 TaxID=3345988 RepID=UPI0036391272